MPDPTEDPGPFWWRWIERHQCTLYLAIVAASIGASLLLPMGWAT